MNKKFQKIAWIAFILLVGGVLVYTLQDSGNGPENQPQAAAGAGEDLQPVEILKYSDYQCPACKMYIPLQEQLKQEFGDMVTIEYRHFPLSGHQYAALAARTVEAAEKQNRRREMHDRIFDGQEVWSSGDAEEIFFDYARELGLDMEQFEQDLNSDEIRQRVERQRAEGERRQVRATPTFFINERRIQQNPQSYEQFRSLVEMHMRQ